MSKEFLEARFVRDNALKLARRIHTDGFVPDVIYVSLRGGAYLGNVISEYFKLVRKGERPVFYAAVVARSYTDIHTSERVMVDGWTYSPEYLRSGDRVLLIDDIFDSGHTVNHLVEIFLEKGIPREDIKSIVLKVGEREQMVERDEKGAFIAKAAPPGSTFATLDGKLQILRDLRCRDYVPQEDDSEADYGLKNPRAVLSLVLRGESGIGKSVLVGESLPDGSAYAAIRGQDGVFILAADVVRILLADLYAQTDRPIE